MPLAAPQNPLVNVGGVHPEQVPAQLGGAADAYKILALDGGGKVPAAAMPAGVGSDIAVVPASEALTPGLVNLWVTGGAVNARKADASAGKPANGYVTANVASGTNASVIRTPGQITGLTGLTPGDQFLATANPGGTQSAAPASGNGYLSQKVGIALSATVLDVRLEAPIQLA